MHNFLFKVFSNTWPVENEIANGWQFAKLNGIVLNKTISGWSVVWKDVGEYEHADELNGYDNVVEAVRGALLLNWLKDIDNIKLNIIQDIKIGDVEALNEALEKHGNNLAVNPL